MKTLDQKYRICWSEYQRDYKRKKRDGTWVRQNAKAGEAKPRFYFYGKFTQEQTERQLELAHMLDMPRVKMIAYCVEKCFEEEFKKKVLLELDR